MIKVKMTQLMAALIIITETKVMLMPTAVSIFLETPKKMQRPRNLVKTKLFIRDADTISSNIFVNSLLIHSPPLVRRVRALRRISRIDPVEKGH